MLLVFSEVDVHISVLFLFVPQLFNSFIRFPQACSSLPYLKYNLVNALEACFLSFPS